MATATSNTTDVADRVSRILAAQLHVNDARIVEAASFDGDLGATSLDMVEVIMTLEDEFDIGIDDRDSEGVRTVGDLLALVKKQVN